VKLSLPTDPGAWINSGPISAETLKGKAALLYYFEEGCPKCRGRWPSLQETAKQFEDKPIVFIAVNSGNAREPVADYAKDVKLNWPIVVDTARQFEKDSGLTNEISLQNIFQVRIVTPDGQFHSGDWNDIEGTANKALAGAKWNVAPEGLPSELNPVRRALEFNTTTGLPSALKSGLSSGDAAVKASAEKLNALVQAKIAAEMQTAKQSYAAGEKWKSYKLVNAITIQYAGLELPEGVAKAKTALSADETVRNQLTAQRELDALRKRARTATPAAAKGIIAKLKELSEKYANTDAGAEATQLLTNISQNAPSN
jgi:thiol-disulfide isomerase/thioredoxin